LPRINSLFATDSQREFRLRSSPETPHQPRLLSLSLTLRRAQGLSLSSNERARGRGQTSRRYNGQVQRRNGWLPTMRAPTKTSPSVASAGTRCYAAFFDSIQGYVTKV